MNDLKLDKKNEQFEKLEEKTNKAVQMEIEQTFMTYLEDIRNFYDNSVYEAAFAVAGEEFANATRDKTILLLGIQNFIDYYTYIPKDKKEFIDVMLMHATNHDPFVDRLKYNSSNSPDEQNSLVNIHNENMSIYSYSLKNVLDSLSEILSANILN